MVWFGMGGGQMTSEFIHEEISIMDYNGLSRTFMGGVFMTDMDDWDGSLEWMTGKDDWHG